MTPAIRRLATGLLFVSGGTGLVYELVWSRYLADVLGNSGQAHAIVLATFMGGLAAGAFAFGRLADRTVRPLMLYGVLEVLVGLYAFAFPSLHGALRSAFLSIAPIFPESTRAFPKLFIAAFSLLLPTALMGGTMPVMLKQITDAPDRMRSLLARLYAVNSVGAAIGVFIAGTALVPAVGLDASGRAAAIVNLTLGAIAIVIGRRVKAPSSVETTTPDPAGLATRFEVRIALLGVVVTGFTSMLYELAWIRLLTLVLGASAYAFTLILTAFISGIALGSFVITRRSGDTGGGRDGLRLFGQLQLMLVIAICLTLPIYVRLPHLFWVAHSTLQRTPETWPVYQGLTFIVCCGVLLLPTFFLGAAFPVGARVAMSGLSTLGRRLGGVYAFNTLGTVSGSLLGGLVLLPWLSMETSFALAIVIGFIAAALALRRARPIALGAVVVVIYLVSTTGWSRAMANLGAFREYDQPYASHREYLAANARDYEVDFYKDDTFATVVVGHLRGQPKHQYMRINGKIDASTGERDVETQILSGHLGALLAPKLPKRVLVIGAGAALTAGSVLSHPIEHLDLVEISPAVLEGAHLFAEANRGALSDPRVSLHIDDAKTFLALEPRKYDLIISVPSNPWVSGVSGLFTTEFFQTIAAHLEDDGVLVQWVHTYESNESLLKLVLRTMRGVFPHSTSWGGNADVVMVTSKQPLSIDGEAIAERMAVPKVRADLERIHIHQLTTLLAKQVHSERAQLDYAGKGPFNTDDLNRLEYAAPVAFFLRQTQFNLGDQRRELKPSPELALTERLPLTVEQARELYDNLAFFHQVDDPLIRSAAERWLDAAPEEPRAKIAVASVALAQGEMTTARKLLQQVTPTDDAQWKLSFDALAKELSDRRSVLQQVAIDPAPFERPGQAASVCHLIPPSDCDLR